MVSLYSPISGPGHSEGHGDEGGQSGGPDGARAVVAVVLVAAVADLVGAGAEVAALRGHLLVLAARGEGRVGLGALVPVAQGWRID